MQLIEREVSIVTVICARNEEEYLEKTLEALLMQTVPIDVIVIDDGSRDSTYEIAIDMGCSVVISSIPHEQSYVGRPELAKIWNMGFKRASILNPDYILVLGADHILPKTYIEQIIKEMENDKDIVVASGRIEGEKFSKDSPRGSGRIIRVSFWKKFGFKYPVAWGWESWILFKAQKEGKKCVCYHDIVSRTSRPTSKTGEKAFYLGKNMKALGYYWIYALGRCTIFFVRNPMLGIKMFLGWRSKEVKELDVAEFVKKKQKLDISKRMRRILK